MARSTREAILTAAVELMRRHGYAGVGMKDIAAAAAAPTGSLYHHFPGGKVDIAAQALRSAGQAYALLLPLLMEPFDDLGEAIASVFDQAADDLVRTGYANMCPVAGVAAEVADTVEELRATSAAVLTEWLDGATAYLRARGVDAVTARQAATAIISTLEGAFILGRTLRDGEPVRTAGRALAASCRGISLHRVSLPTGVAPTD